MITLDRVSKRFGETLAVDGVSLSVGEGRTLVLLGSSGCGKTTTLRMINLLVRPTSGTISVDGRDVTEAPPEDLRRSIGYVIQHVGLFPHMTVAENVGVVPRLLGWDRRRRRARAEELLELVGLGDGSPGGSVADRMPRELSGGQQQRVGLARALAGDPPVLLMDEPFGALDAITRDTLQGELIELRERLGKTIVFVTHDIFEALRLGDQVGVMHAGRLEQVGTGEELIEEPATPFVGEFFSHARRQAALVGAGS